MHGIFNSGLMRRELNNQSKSQLLQLPFYPGIPTFLKPPSYPNNFPPPPFSAIWLIFQLLKYLQSYDEKKNFSILMKFWSDDRRSKRRHAANEERAKVKFHRWVNEWFIGKKEDEREIWSCEIPVPVTSAFEPKWKPNPKALNWSKKWNG